MWCIARVDLPEPKYADNPPYSNYLASPGLFGLVWAPRLTDLPGLDEIRAQSGFVRPSDDLVIVRPDGTIRLIQEGTNAGKTGMPT